MNRIPLILIFGIVTIIFLNPFLSDELKEVLYSLSLSIKSVIIFILPIVIFCLLFRAIVSFSQNATQIILSILILVCISNFIATMFGGFLGSIIYNFDISFLMQKNIIL